MNDSRSSSSKADNAFASIRWVLRTFSRDTRLVIVGSVRVGGGNFDPVRVQAEVVTGSSG